VVTLLHHSIAKQAGERPEQVAFRCRDQSLTYQSLYKRSSQLANLLISLGIESMDRVGIFTGKAIELPIAIYGILAAGAAYIPIDPNSPIDRLEFLLNDCGIEVLITSNQKIKVVQKIATNNKTALRCLIGIPENSIESIQSIPWSAIEAFTHSPPRVSIQEDDLAYVMYTSGSTGTPKGLMHTHRSGLSYARYSSYLYKVSSSDILGNHAPLHFDISTFEFLTGPYSGATSVLIPEEELMFPASLAKFIEREKLTFWYSVPLALIQLLTRGDLSGVNLDSLRYILFGGEPFPPKYLAKLVALLPNAHFCNVYGPAEVNQCTNYQIPPDYQATDQPIPIGHVWPGAKALIVDETDRPLPSNQIGELIVASSTMMHGYWGRPNLNETAFYNEEPIPGFQRRYYRTGDLFKMDSEGLLHFCGRKDRQIKIRGYRFELDEVEAAFTAQTEIEEAVAVMVHSSDDESEIVVAVILRNGIDFDPTKAIAFARSKLPHYGVPSRIEVLTSFPRTPTGKPNRPSLAASISS